MTCSQSKIRRTFDVLLLIGLASLALPGQADPAPQSLDDIQNQVHDFIAADADNTSSERRIQVGKLDPRLRLAACDQALNIEYANPNRRSGNTSVKVHCDGQTPWAIYVAVEIQEFGDVLIVQHRLPAGHLLTPADLRTETRELGTLVNGYYQNLQQINELETKRPIAANTALSPNQVQQHKLVRQGDLVTIQINQGGISVRSQGRALSDASRGQRVKIKNEHSGRIIEGRVTAEGTVDAH